MSLQWHLSAEIPAETKQIGQRLFPETNVYRQIGDRFGEIFPGDEIFASMYDPGGRGAEPPMLMGLVTVFQVMERVPDRVAAEWVVSRLDWKYALHLPLDYAGFHFTDLLAFRKRLLEHQQERVLFDSFLGRLRSLGLIKSGGKMRTDSTHVLGLLEKLGRMELVTESVRLAVEAIAKAAPHWTETHLPAAFLETYPRRQSEYGLSNAQVQAKLMQAGQDGFWLLNLIDQAGTAALRNLPEVAVLRQVLTQQFPHGPHASPPAQRPAGKQVIESPHEPEARYGKKREKKWSGYKAQITETCDDQLPHLFVDLEPSGAADHDSLALPGIQQRLVERAMQPAEQYVDQGYISAERIYTSAAAGIALMGKPLADTRSSQPFQQAQFHIDEATQQATCPAGKTSSAWSETQKSSWPASQVVIRFSGTVCQPCTFFGQCTVNPKGRSLELHPFRTTLAEYREQALLPDFQKKLHRRAGIEASISELVRIYQLRYCRYRGLSKLHLQTYFTAVAANLKRLARWWALQTPPYAETMVA